MKKLFYSFNKILEISEKEKTPAIVIVGGKGNGKTYSVIEHYLEIFLTKGYCLRYLRRYADSIRPKAIQSLLKPQIKNITIMSGGKYNNYMYYQNRFYLTKTDKNGNKIAKCNNPFIICGALNAVESYTGADEGQCSAIFFDEFLSREKELKDEFNSLMIYHNNCLRNRTEVYTPLILVGNTVSRTSSLSKDFGINLFNLTKGEITIVKNSKKETVAVVEYCETTQKMDNAGKTIYSKFAKDVKMIYSGDWQVSNYPRLSVYKYESSTNILNVLLKKDEIELILSFNIYKNNVYGYVKQRERENIDIICINRVDITPPNTFTHFDLNIKFFKLWLKLNSSQKIFFKNCEVGELYRDFLLNFKNGEPLGRVYN